MIGQFALHRRSQHSAAAADDSASVVVYDLFMGFQEEAQARHLTLTENPLDTVRLVAELGQPVSKEKLSLAQAAPVVIKPNATGAREQGQSVTGENTNTRIEMIDSGEVEIVSDQDDAKIFKFVGKTLNGRMLLHRDANSKNFNVSIDTGDSKKVEDKKINTEKKDNSIEEKTEEDKESDQEAKLDPEPLSVEDFISPEFDEVISDIIEKKDLSDDVSERMTAIRHRLAEKTISNRDVIFVLKFISGGESAAIKSQEESEVIALSLWDPSEYNTEITYLDSDTGDKYKVVPDGEGTYSIPRFEFISRGTYNDEDFDDKKIDKIIENFKFLSKTEILDVPVKIGHHKKQSLLGNSGELAHGWISDAWAESSPVGRKGFVKISGMPKTLAYLISKRALKNRSAEIFENVNYGGKDYGPTLKAISFLGTSTPAVLGMQSGVSGKITSDPAVQMYEQDGSKVIIVKPNSGSASVADEKLISLSPDDLNNRINSAVQEAVEKMKKVADADAKMMSAQVTELSLKLKSEQDARRKEFVKLNKAANVSEFDLLVKGGHMLPAQKDEFMQFCTILDGVSDMAKGRDPSDMFETIKPNKDTLEFSVEVMENDKKVEINTGIKGLFFRMLKGQKQIDLSVQTKDGKILDKKVEEKSKVSVSDEIHALTKKIMADEKIDYADAFSKAYAQKFGDEAAEAAIEGRTSVPANPAE